MSQTWPERFRDRVMLVTGGASGIGRATVERAAAEGAAVIILDRDGDGATRLAGTLTAAGHTALAVTADITDDRQVADAVAEPAYSAAKAGLLQLTRQLATEYGPRGVRANAVVPGSIRTPIWDRCLPERPGLLDDVGKWYPVGRAGRLEEVAAAMLFLASAEAGFINGASLVVDGGLTVGLGPMMREIRGTAED